MNMGHLYLVKLRHEFDALDSVNSTLVLRLQTFRSSVKLLMEFTKVRLLEGKFLVDPDINV